MELLVLLGRFLGFRQGIPFIWVKASSSPRLLLAESGPRGCPRGLRERWEGAGHILLQEHGVVQGKDSEDR